MANDTCADTLEETRWELLVVIALQVLTLLKIVYLILKKYINKDD